MTALCNHCTTQSPPFLLRARRPYPAGRPPPAPPPPGSREDPPNSPPAPASCNSHVLLPGGKPKSTRRSAAKRPTPCSPSCPSCLHPAPATLYPPARSPPAYIRHPVSDLARCSHNLIALCNHPSLRSPPARRIVVSSSHPRHPAAEHHHTLCSPPNLTPPSPCLLLYQRAHRSLISHTTAHPRQLSNFPTSQQIDKPESRQVGKLASWQAPPPIAANPPTQPPAAGEHPSLPHPFLLPRGAPRLIVPVHHTPCNTSSPSPALRSPTPCTPSTLASSPSPRTLAALRPALIALCNECTMNPLHSAIPPCTRSTSSRGAPPVFPGLRPLNGTPTTPPLRSPYPRGKPRNRRAPLTLQLSDFPTNRQVGKPESRKVGTHHHPPAGERPSTVHTSSHRSGTPARSPPDPPPHARRPFLLSLPRR